MEDSHVFSSVFYPPSSLLFPFEPSKNHKLAGGVGAA